MFSLVCGIQLNQTKGQEIVKTNKLTIGMKQTAKEGMKGAKTGEREEHKGI